MGKPQGQDLASGNLTAPTIFALKANSELRGLIENQFENEGDLQKAIDGQQHVTLRRRDSWPKEGDIALASLDSFLIANRSDRYRLWLGMFSSASIKRINFAARTHESL